MERGIYPLEPPAVLYRVHDRRRPPLTFSREPRGRFDAPDGTFGTCYVALEPATAIVETLLREPLRRFISKAEISRRTLSEIAVVAALRLADLGSTAALQKRGLDLRMVFGPYEQSRALAHRIHRTEAVHGLIWPSRFGADGRCVVLFDRVGTGVRVVRTWSDGVWWAQVLQVMARCGKAPG